MAPALSGCGASAHLARPLVLPFCPAANHSISTRKHSLRLHFRWSPSCTACTLPAVHKLQRCRDGASSWPALVQVVDVPCPSTTASYRRYMVESIAQDIKDSICRCVHATGVACWACERVGGAR